MYILIEEDCYDFKNKITYRIFKNRKDAEIYYTALVNYIKTQEYTTEFSLVEYPQDEWQFEMVYHENENEIFYKLRIVEGEYYE